MYIRTVVKNILQNKFWFLALTRMMESPAYNNIYIIPSDSSSVITRCRPVEPSVIKFGYTVQQYYILRLNLQINYRNYEAPSIIATKT